MFEATSREARKFWSRTTHIIIRPLAAGLVCVAVLCFAAAASAQESREAERAAQQAEKATRWRPYEPQVLEQRLDKLDAMLFYAERSFYPLIGSAFGGGGLAVGRGYRTRFGAAAPSTRTRRGRSRT